MTARSLAARWRSASRGQGVCGMRCAGRMRRWDWQAAGGDEAFRLLVLARIIESASKQDSCGSWGDWN